MGQLLTLMVFGDAITVNDDNDIEDEEANGATISGPPGLEIRDPEIGYSRSDAAVVGGLHGTDSNADRAGQRVGEHFRRDLSALDTWKCAVHHHRTVLDGKAQRRPAGSSGVERGRDGNDEGGRLQLMEILRMPDEVARMQAFQHYFAASGTTVGGGRPGDTEELQHQQRQSDPRSATQLLHQ